MKITIQKALSLLQLTEKIKQERSELGLNSLRLNNQLKEVLNDFKRKEFAQKIQLCVKGEKGEFLFSPEAELAFQNWFARMIKEEVEVEPMITTDISLFKDRIDLIDICNGILCDVDLNEFIK